MQGYQLPSFNRMPKQRRLRDKELNLCPLCPFKKLKLGGCNIHQSLGFLSAQLFCDELPSGWIPGLHCSCQDSDDNLHCKCNNMLITAHSTVLSFEVQKPAKTWKKKQSVQDCSKLNQNNQVLRFGKGIGIGPIGVIFWVRPQLVRNMETHQTRVVTPSLLPLLPLLPLRQVPDPPRPKAPHFPRVPET